MSLSLQFWEFDTWRVDKHSIKAPPIERMTNLEALHSLNKCKVVIPQSDTKQVITYDKPNNA